MTNDDKDLLARLIDTREYHCMMYSQYDTVTEAADRIEALSARLAEADALLEKQNEDIGRLREALTRIARMRTDLAGDFSLGSHQSDIARAALGEQQ